MPQATLFAPDVTCDHCIATIKKAVEGVEGARFLDGDPDSKSFSVDLAQGALLDRLAEVLAAEGYPLGEARPAGGSVSAPGMGVSMALPMLGGMTGGVSMGAGLATAATPASGTGFRPTLDIAKSDEGAHITYNCRCGSTTEEYVYDRSKPEQAVGSCCGHHLLVQPGAGARLREIVGAGYEVTVQTVEMPWGQPVEAAFASKS